MSKKFILFILISGITLSLFSQKKQNKIKALKIAYITEKLDLTSDEAEKFWPIYNAFLKRDFQLRRIEIKAIRKKISAKGGIDNFSESEASKILENLMRIDEDLYLTKKKLNTDLIAVISTKKIIKLYKAEQEFKRKLLMRLRGKKNNR